MKTRSLVKLVTADSGAIHLTFFRPAFSLPWAAPSLDYAINVAKEICLKTIEIEGKPWVQHWSSPDGQPNCPEGAIELPSDIWMCKLSGKICIIQATVSVDRKKFFEGCHAPRKKKEQIHDLVSNGKYLGFHHVPGRYLCVGCESKGGKKESYFYHYPWEFAELDVALLMSHEELYALLMERNYSHIYVTCPICASCCKEMAERIDPLAARGLHVLEFEVNMRPGGT